MKKHGRFAALAWILSLPACLGFAASGCRLDTKGELAPPVPLHDTDRDTIPDTEDNCRLVPNLTQANFDEDEDMFGNACEERSGEQDLDGDGIPDRIDACWSPDDSDQEYSGLNNMDCWAYDNACSRPDDSRETIVDPCDNCPLILNPLQENGGDEDIDGDTVADPDDIGDACEDPKALLDPSNAEAWRRVLNIRLTRVTLFGGDIPVDIRNDSIRWVDNFEDRYWVFVRGGFTCTQEAFALTCDQLAPDSWPELVIAPDHYLGSRLYTTSRQGVMALVRFARLPDPAPPAGALAGIVMRVEGGGEAASWALCGLGRSGGGQDILAIRMKDAACSDMTDPDCLHGMEVRSVQLADAGLAIVQDVIYVLQAVMDGTNLRCYLRDVEYHNDPSQDVLAWVDASLAAPPTESAVGLMADGVHVTFLAASIFAGLPPQPQEQE